MKTDIHPTYYADAVTICMSCSAKFNIGSTLQETKIEVCSECHPFYTGKQDHIMDTAGRVDKFKAKMEKAKAYQEQLAKKNQTDQPEEEEVAEESAEKETVEALNIQAANEAPAEDEAATEEASDETPAEETAESTEDKQAA